MVSDKRDDLLDAVDLTFGMSTSASTEASHETISLVVKSKKKV